MTEALISILATVIIVLAIVGAITLVWLLWPVHPLLKPMTPEEAEDWRKMCRWAEDFKFKSALDRYHEPSILESIMGKIKDSWPAGERANLLRKPVSFRIIGGQWERAPDMVVIDREVIWGRLEGFRFVESPVIVNDR